MGRRECCRVDFVFGDLIKSCGISKDLSGVATLHAHILEQGLLLHTNPSAAASLIRLYAECGALKEAQHVLETLQVRHLLSWNALIAGYARQGLGHEALDSFDRMCRDGLSPDELTFTHILQACSITRVLTKGKQIHDEIVRRGLFGTSIVLGNALVDMYTKCGALTQAQRVLEELPLRNVVTWSILIAGYARKGKGHEALQCFEDMKREGLCADEITFACVLMACGSIKALDNGRQIHEEIVQQGLLKQNAVLGNALVGMYVKCGAVGKARLLLEELPVRNVVSWNTIIAGYAQEGNGAHEALNCYAQMQREGLTPTDITFTCILKACSSIGDLSKGEEIHSEINKRGLLKKNAIVGNALVDMYAKCRALEKAQEALNEHPARNAVCWNALIAGYVAGSRGNEALACFEKMQREGISPDGVTYIAILKACGTLSAISKGKQFHHEIINKDLLGTNILLETSLVDMYARCGMLASAQKIHESLHVRDTVSWNALIAGYAEEGRGHEALDCFAQMQREGISPDEVTFTCIMKACGRIGAFGKGKQIHEEIASLHFLEKSIALSNAVVDMYVKCGMLTNAQQLLEELPVRDTVSWSTLIAGYAEKGYYHEALNCFEQMQMESVSPNKVTLLCVLNACSHSGKLDDAEAYYANMSTKYGIRATVEHHTCMVISFGQAGRFDKAMMVIKSVSCLDDPSSLWLALLGTCAKWGNVKLARLSFDHVLQTNPELASAYVVMANIYAAAGMREEAEEVENRSMLCQQ